jgi:TonB family protein
MQLKDTVVYYEDGTYTKFESSEAVDPFTGELRKTFTVKNFTAEGTPNPNINFTIREVEKHGDTMMYSMDPFTISGDIVNKLKNKIMTDEDIDVEVTEVGCVDNDTVYNIVEQMPEYPGGVEAMMKYIAENVKYPEEAKDKNIAGRVFLAFVVEKDGSVSNVKVLRGIGGGCDEEAARVINSMPKWKPGKQKGKPVRVSFQIPIYFKLDTPQKTNSLVGSVWEGTGTGTKGGVTYTWHSILQFNSENEGLLIEKLVSQKKNEKPVVEFENVAMDFEYAFDGKKTGAITPKNGDGTYMDEQPPEGFILSDDGKTLVLNFYTATDDTGIKFVTYTRR